MRVAFVFIFTFLSTLAHAAQSSCTVPLDESLSAPAIDLIQNGASVDRDLLMDQIKNGFDTSSLEPQKSDLYVGSPQATVQFAEMPYPGDHDSLNFVSSLGNVSGLVRARVVLKSNPSIAYQLNLSLDAHAALARNALFRKLGYAIPSPKHYPTITVNFPDLDTRDSFLDNLAGDTLTARSRWVVGGIDEINKKNLALTFNDAVLEPAVIEVPQMHWGIFPSTVLDSRRSLRALLVPLTLLDITESVNMYSYEPAKIFNEGISFTRGNAAAFSNETSIGDVKWITAKIAKLNRSDWTDIIQAGRYPADIQALLVEKTIGRVDQLMNLLQQKDFKPIPYNVYLTYGNIINGKATKELYDNYALRFTYGDPKSPLRASELLRFFGIDIINGGLSYVMEQANQYLQAITPAKYVTEHNASFISDIINHFQNHPDQPYVQPVALFGGPVLGGNVNASRNIVTGTYYGSKSQIQLVDSISAGVNVGGFFGISGIKNVGASLGPAVQYSRSYVHVRPLTDIKTAWKDKWSNILVPNFMNNLAKVLAGKKDEAASDAVKAFLGQMKTGEMFIVTDGLSAGLQGDVQIPIGAILGVVGMAANISADVAAGVQYAILSRTTIYKTDDGIQVYLNRIHSGNFQAELDLSFFIKVIGLTNTTSLGNAHTRAFVFPDKFETDEKTKSFQTDLFNILKRNNPEMMEEDFEPYNIDHQSNGNRFKLAIGPWSWSTRENYHELNITPPIDPDHKYEASDFKRTILQGQVTKISGSDFLGFLGTAIKKWLPYLSIGGASLGDDPSSNVGGKSTTFAVSTQIETTASRPNHLFTQVQQAHTGWSLSKNGLMKLLSKVSESLGQFNPNGGLIDQSEFTQTRKIQAYTILWNLLIYENGVKRVLDILDIKTTSTLATQNFLIKLYGTKEYFAYCKTNELEPNIQSGPYIPRDPGSIVESANGQMFMVACAPSFFQTVYSLRSQLESHPAVFMSEVRREDDTKDKIRWVNRAMTKLNDDLSLNQYIQWIGTENSFFQVNVSGFRTKDENGDSEYYSNTVGTVNQDVLTGPISEISSTSSISTHELEARYLSDGY